MAAEVGNKFWELRSKHGRDKLFETPELMWEAACEYFEWCVENPLIEIDYRGKFLERVELPKMRAFTMQGLCGYLGCNTAYFRTFKSQERENKEGFNTVIGKIEEIIYNQKFTGAAAGFLNANIIARDLGLSEKQDNRFVDGEGNDIQIIQLPHNNRDEPVIRPTCNTSPNDAMGKPINTKDGK